MVDLGENLDDSSSSDESDIDMSDEETDVEFRPPKYSLPVRNQGNTAAVSKEPYTGSARERKFVRRGRRTPRPPQWIQAGNWEVGCREHVFEVYHSQVVYT